MKPILTFVLGGVVVLGGVWLVKRDKSPATEQPAVTAEQPIPGAEEPAAPPMATNGEEPAAPVQVAKNPSPHMTGGLAPEPPSQPAVVPMAPPPSTTPEPAPTHVSNDNPAAPAPPEPAAPAPPPPPQPKTVTLAEGTLIPVRLLETVSTETNQPGDSFQATLDQPIVIDGFVIAEKGARVDGKIVSADRSGRVKGLAHIALELTHINTADKQHVAVTTASFEKDAEKSTKDDATKVGIGAALGAAIGAIAGGGKGAAIGAAAGGGAGTGAVLATRGKEAVIPVETKLSFRLTRPVSITEKLR